MGMPEVIYKKLKEVCKEEKITVDSKEVSLFDYIAGDRGLHEKAENAIKIQDANKDLTEQRKTWEDEKKTLKTDNETITKERDELKKTQLSETEREKLKTMNQTGMTPEAEAKLNAAIDSAKTSREMVDKLTKDIGDANNKANSARLNGAEKDLDNRLLTELSKNKITGEKAAAALTLIKSSGYAKVYDEEGTTKERFCTFADGKELDASFESAVKGFSEKNEYLIDGTSVGGTGNNHSSGAPASGGQSFASMMRTYKS